MELRLRSFCGGRVGGERENKDVVHWICYDQAWAPRLASHVEVNMLIETRVRTQFAYRNAVVNSICLSNRGR